MLSWIREKFGTVMIGGIIGFIAFVFIFYGVFSPKATRGLHEGAVAGFVNGDAITLSEFNREYTRRVETVKGMFGGKISEEQLGAFRLKESVFDDIVRRKLLVQESKKQGIQVADEQVREVIREMPVFQKDKHFDVLTYKQVLEANQYTPGSFEKLVRDDLAAQLWQRYFAQHVSVSVEELRREYESTENKRKLKYVVLNSEALGKLIQVTPAEIQKYLAEESKLNLVKAQFEGKKETLYKGKTLDSVKEGIARELIAGSRLEEVQKIGNQLAEKIKTVMTASQSSDAKVNQMLKSVGLGVKTTDWLTRSSSVIQGLGDATPLLKDAFSKSENLSGPKKYSLAAGLVVALVSEVHTPDFSKFDEQRETLLGQVNLRKQQGLYQAWITQLTQRAKVEKNATVLGLEKS